VANLTAKQRAGQEAIKKKIVEAHRRGACDRDGHPITPRIYGTGGLAGGLVTFGEQKLRVWPRDENGNLLD